MSGIFDQDVRQKLLAINPFPTLKDVVHICRSHESAAKDSLALMKTIPIDKISHSTYKKKKKYENFEKNCQKCGYGQHDRSKCPVGWAEFQLFLKIHSGYIPKYGPT